MRPLSLQSNPRFAEFQGIMKGHPEWLKPWSGSFFRFQTTEFPSAKFLLGVLLDSAIAEA